MLTVSHPFIIPLLREFSCGIWPINIGVADERRLIVKATKETILTAKLRGGFKVYVIPITLESQATFGLTSAFFDDEDEPLVIWTPIFSDYLTSSLPELLSLRGLDVHFFDEHDREWLGYTSRIDVPAQIAKQLADATFPSWEPDFARSAIDQMTAWFGTRTEADDLLAISVVFESSLFPEDYFILDTRPESHPYQGGPQFNFSQLQREEPGIFQEQDIARLLGKVFASTEVYMNPLRVDDRREIADILVITQSEVLMIQAKDSPNTEQLIGTSIQRKKATASKALEKGMNQVAGAVRYLRSQSIIEMIVGGSTIRLDISKKRCVSLIVVKELFDEVLASYSEQILKLAREIQIPCVALGYQELVQYSQLSSPAKFLQALDFIYSEGARVGQFPRLRIWSDE